MSSCNRGPLDMVAAVGTLLGALFGCSACLTSIVFCSARDQRPLLVTAFFPVGVVHGSGGW